MFHVRRQTRHSLVSGRDRAERKGKRVSLLRLHDILGMFERPLAIDDGVSSKQFVDRSIIVLKDLASLFSKGDCFLQDQRVSERSHGPG